MLRCATEGGARELRQARKLPLSPQSAQPPKGSAYTSGRAFILVGTKPVEHVLGRREGSTKSSLRGMGTTGHGLGAMVSHTASNIKHMPGLRRSLPFRKRRQLPPAVDQGSPWTRRRPCLGLPQPHHKGHAIGS